MAIEGVEPGSLVLVRLTGELGVQQVYEFRRYWVFAGQAYYPLAGLEDLRHRTANKDEARQMAADILKESAGSGWREDVDWALVLDVLEAEVVYRRGHWLGQTDIGKDIG